MFKYSKDQLLQMKRLSDDLRISQGDCGTSLTPVLLEQLVYMVKNYMKWRPDINYIFEQPAMTPCGCLGPCDGQLYCPCRMEQLRYQYRYYIALEML